MRITQGNRPFAAKRRGEMPYCELSASVQTLIRACCGILQTGFLLLTLPNFHHFFLSERYGGYAKSDAINDITHSPWAMRLLGVLWFASAIGLVLGLATPWAALLNLIFCRYFFVSMRWKSIARGMGAPGFMTYWLAAMVFFLEYTAHFDSTGTLRHVAILAFKIDFAVIMLCAGQYKLFAGYPQNNGMERGMVNPWWGYWWRIFSQIPPSHLLFRTLNQLAWLTEVVAGALMLIPPLQELGAALIIGSFVFIRLTIRLGFLCETVMVGAFAYFYPGGLVDSIVSRWLPTPLPVPMAATPALNLINTALAVFFWIYIVLLPLSKAGLYYNFYAGKRLPEFWQKALETWTNLWGIIIWRVFTVDNTNFFVRVWQQNRRSGERRLYSRFGTLDAATRFRYLHVCEFVCFVSVFTTLKYYPNNPSLFHERLLCYARTIPCADEEILVFEYVDVKKTAERFEYVSSAEFDVDVGASEVRMRKLADGSSETDALRFSNLHEGARPGTYAPASR